jgi:RecA-family ATPase
MSLTGHYDGLNPSFEQACRRADDERRRRSSAGARRFTLFAELEATSTKSWLVHNLLGDGDASVAYGKPGDGKSVLAEDLALHVAAGRPWHGRKVKQGAVVFVALERRKLVERRAIAFREKHGLHDLPFAIVGGVHDLRHPSTVATLVEIVKEVETETGQKVVLIVIDTISRALCGGDENSPKDMGAIVAATSLLQTKTAAHILWVHHVPLDGGDRLRGHGALLGAMDTTISVVKAAGR